MFVEGFDPPLDRLQDVTCATTTLYLRHRGWREDTKTTDCPSTMTAWRHLRCPQPVYVGRREGFRDWPRRLRELLAVLDRVEDRGWREILADLRRLDVCQPQPRDRHLEMADDQVRDLLAWRHRWKLRIPLVHGSRIVDVRPGDRFWVKEAWRSPEVPVVPGRIAYRADGRCGAWTGDGGGSFVFWPHGWLLQAPGPVGKGDTFDQSKYGRRWHAAKTMPRWAARLWVIVSDVERTISEGKALSRVRVLVRNAS